MSLLSFRDVVAERAACLEPLGFTERQSRFLATVMAHSGVFLERQYCRFAGIAHGQKSHDFVHRLVQRGFGRVEATSHLHQGRFYHLHHKRLYGRAARSAGQSARRQREAAVQVARAIVVAIGRRCMPSANVRAQSMGR